MINKYHLSIAAVLHNCAHGCIKRAFAWAAVTQTLDCHSCPDLLSRRSPVRQHRAESRLTKPRSARVTGNEEATGGGRAVRRTGGGARCCLSFCLFYLFKSQECKSLKPSDLRAGTRWRWCRDLKADPPCVSHRQRPHLCVPLSSPAPLLPQVSQFIVVCRQTHLCIFCLFLLCAERVRSWTLFYMKLKSKSNKNPLRGPFIIIVCSLKATEPVVLRLVCPSTSLMLTILPSLTRQFTLRKFITLRVCFYPLFIPRRKFGT